MNFGCSSFTWETKNGLHLLGRTYDQFGNLDANRVIGVPEGILCSPLLSKKDGDAPGQFGYTGMAVLGFGEPIVVDGVNSAGLMGALLHYPGYAFYQSGEKPGTTAVHPGRLLAWLLSRCASMEEAVEAMAHITLVDEPIQGKPLAAHYILSDKTGEAVIIEPDRDGLSVHRNTIGVMTNSPDYLWHRTNLRNYVGVTNLPMPPRSISGQEFRAFSERLSGGFGLPGDYSSTSRFVRTAFIKEFAVPGENELDGVSRMFRAFAPVEIPEGLAKETLAGCEYEQTLCISVMCAESGVYYFSPAWNRRISAVRLTHGREIQHFGLGDRQDIDYRN